jgi:cysteine desulfurase
MQNINRIYFDHASSTHVKKEALEEFARVADEYFANASSIHAEGEMSKEMLEKLRKDFAFLIRAKKSEVHFVSSSTEANNIFIQGAVEASLKAGQKPHIITSLAEHASILEPIRAMEQKDVEVTYIVPNEFGQINTEHIKKALQANTLLVALSSVHSETGTIQPIREVALMLQNYAKKNNINKPLLYIDATQAVEYDTVDVGTLLCDGMTFGARKIGALGGVALLYIKRNVDVGPIIFGGGQEGGLKSGTENLALIAAFLKIGQEVIADKTTKQNNFNLVTNLKIYLLNKIENELGDEVKVVSSTKLKNINSKKEDSEEFRQLQFFVHSSPHITLLHIPKILGEEMVLRLDAKGIAVSTASACSITEGSGSNLLKSLGKDKEAKETVRISFSRANTFAEVDIFVKNLKEIIEKYQTMLN